MSISGGGLSAPVSFSFTAGGLTTAQDLAQSLQSQITSQISGQQPDSELFVEVATDATSESGVSLVLRSAEAPITTNLDFESTLFGEPGSQSFTTVALPSEISEGDTLELTLGGLATESGTVSVSQTIDPGETLSDVATSLVADLSGLTNDAGDPLGLSGEVVTVDDGFGGVQTEPPIPTSTDRVGLALLSCRIWKIFRSRRAPFRRTSLWRRWRSRRMRRFPVSLEAPSLRCRSRVAV